jgi:hypothetical protein
VASAGLLLLVSGVSCVRAADEAAIDSRAAMGLPEAVAGVHAQRFVFNGASSMLQAVQDAPEGWLPPDDAALVEAGGERNAHRFGFDRDGWLVSSDLTWLGDDGWRMSLRWQRPGRAPPNEVRMLMVSPDGVEHRIGRGDIVHRGGVEQVLTMDLDHPVQGRGHFKRVERFDADGRLSFDEGITRYADRVERHVLKVVERDARGFIVRSRDLIDGVWFDVATRYYGADAHGLPARSLKSFFEVDADPARATVARAELTFYEYQYDNEAR